MSTEILGYPKSIWLIFGNEFCERFSYHGLKTILVLFFAMVQKYDHDTSTIIFHSFLVSAYLAPFLGAIVADSYWGKYKTIFILSIIHAIGNIVVSVASLITSVSLQFQRLFTIVGLLLTSIGAGGIKPCVSSFGGDQFELPDQEDQLQKFFSVFYFFVNAGSLLSMFITPELRKSVQCFGKDSCFPLAFGVPAILMLLSIVFFVRGKSLYIIKKPVSSVIPTSIGCMFHALKNKIKGPSNIEKNYWLEYANDKYNEREIFELRSALDVMYMFIPLPVFYTLFDQLGSRWILQAILMNGKIDFLNWSVKPDQIHLVNPLFVLIFIPIFDAFVYPLFAKIGMNTPLRKIALGGMFAASSFVCAAIIQYTIFGKTIAISSDESYLKIYNNLDCKVDIYSRYTKGNFNIDTLGEIQINYSSAIKETDALSINVDLTCKLKINTFKRIVKIVKGQVFYYVLSYKNEEEVELKQLEQMNKLRNGNPNLRILHDNNLLDRNITLKDISNKLTEINIQLPSNQNQTYEIPVGTYDIYLDDGYILQKVNFLPASVNNLLFIHNHNHTNAKFMTIEHGRYIHILWQVPQIILMSIGEVMFVVTLLEFSFTQAPTSMKSFLTAAFYCTQAVGNLLIIIISKMNLFDSQGHEFLFYAILLILDMLLFMTMSVKYRYKHLTRN